jgi:hypothetical protein
MTPHRDKPRNSTVNVSQLVATFTDYDERSAPYDGRAMRLALVADVLFVQVGTLTEGSDGDSFTCDAAHSIGVDAEIVYEALGAMLRRDDRHSSERAREGTLPADHPALVTVSTGGLAHGVRRRA